MVDKRVYLCKFDEILLFGKHGLSNDVSKTGIYGGRLGVHKIIRNLVKKANSFWRAFEMQM